MSNGYHTYPPLIPASCSPVRNTPFKTASGGISLNDSRDGISRTKSASDLVAALVSSADPAGCRYRYVTSLTSISQTLNTLPRSSLSTEFVLPGHTWVRFPGRLSRSTGHASSIRTALNRPRDKAHEPASFLRRLHELLECSGSVVRASSRWQRAGGKAKPTTDNGKRDNGRGGRATGQGVPERPGTVGDRAREDVKEPTSWIPCVKWRCRARSGDPIPGFTPGEDGIKIIERPKPHGIPRFFRGAADVRHQEHVG